MIQTEIAQARGRLCPRTFFDQFHTAYRSAERACGRLTRNYQVAGRTLRLCFAGPMLMPLLTPALAHLAVPDSVHPDLTLCLWESESTGIRPPACPWTADQVDRRGEVPAFSNNDILTAVQRDVNAVSLLDRAHSRGVYWIDSVDSLFAYECAAPLKVLLHWWLRDYGLSMIHAGAVGNENGAVLIVGQTGAGKSTTALACFSAGMDYIADDRCLLELAPVARVYAVYNAAKVYGEQMRRLPHLLPFVDNTEALDTEKALLYIHQIAPDQVAETRPVRAVLLARITGRLSTSLAPVSRAHVLRDFATSTLVYQPGAARAEVQMMAELVRSVPCYQLELGSDLAGIAPVIGELLA